MAKRGPLPTLQSLIRQKALHSTPPTDADIQHLLVALLHDLPDDVGRHAQGGDVKRKILMDLHTINKDNKPVESTGDLDNDLLQLLAARAAKKATT